MTASEVPALSLKRISKTFIHRQQEVRALQEVSLAVGYGEIFGLIGHNGAGKSTLIKGLLGIYLFDVGEVRIHGELVDNRTRARMNGKIGYVPDILALYNNLTGRETLRFFARLKGVSDPEVETALQRVGLREAAGRRVGGYSKGMRQRLGLAQALLGHPPLLILDEPFNGLDPQGLRDVIDVLREYRDQGNTVVLSSHILPEMEGIVDRVAILLGGRLVAEGTTPELMRQLDLPVQVEIETEDPGVALARDIPGLRRLEQQGGQIHLSLDPQGGAEYLAPLLGELGHLRRLRIFEPTLGDLYLALVRQNIKEEGS